MDRHYGPNKIVNSKEIGKNIELEYQSGEKEIVSKKLYTAGVTEKVSDLTSLRERRMKPVLESILSVLLDYDIKPFEPMNEIDFILSGIKTSYEANFRKADEKKWGLSPDKLKFSDIDKALKDD